MENKEKQRKQTTKNEKKIQITQNKKASRQT